MFQDDWSGLKEVIKETQEFISVKLNDLIKSFIIIKYPQTSQQSFPQ